MPRFRNSLELAALLLVLLGLGSRFEPVWAQQSPANRGRMKLIYPQPGNVLAVDAELQRLRPAPLAPLPKAALEAAGAYAMPYGNARLNSRAAALGMGSLREIWRADLSPDTKPRFVLQSDAHVAVQGPIWQLFDMAGKSLGMGSKGPAPMHLDGRHGALLVINPTGLLGVHGVRDGKRQFFVMPDAGERAGYTLPSSRV
jgi:hypothetical protein